jgi:uncharacterized protein YndB with AHSA1/START domain
VPDHLHRDGSVRGAHLERDYNGTPAELWQCWTDPKRLARWLGALAGPLLPAGGPVRLVLGDDPGQWADVRVLAAAPPHLLTLAWDIPGQPGTVLTVAFTAVAPGRTRVVVDHRGLGPAATGYGAGWQAYLDGGLRLETGEKAGASWEHLFEAALPGWRDRAASGPA